MAMIPHVLIVAGSDSSGGAGIARDVETVATFGLRTCLAVTAVTVQTHTAVEHIEPMPPQLIAAQMCAAFAANRIAAVKIGMLGTISTIEAVGAVLRSHPQVPVVLDPVIASTSGRVLLPHDAMDALINDLMPVCRLVTPNLLELAALTGSPPALDEGEARLQGEALSAMIGTAVLAKGGHARKGQPAVDLLVQPDCPVLRLEAPRLDGQERGTGCMLSSAISACLALNSPLEPSVAAAKRHVFDILSMSAQRTKRSGPVEPDKTFSAAYS